MAGKAEFQEHSRGCVYWLKQFGICLADFCRKESDNFQLNKIAARWPAKAVAQFYFIDK